MWVNGELRFSNEELMNLWHLVSLGMDELDGESESLGPQDVEKARELERKAEAGIGLLEMIYRELAERLDHGADANHPQE